MGFEFLEAKNINLSMAEIAIKRINASIGWSQYDEFVMRYLTQKSKAAEFFFAQQDGHINGYVVTHNGILPNEEHIPCVAVEQQVQHQGIGAALILEVIRKAQTKQKEFITLDCQEEKIGFYKTIAMRTSLNFTHHFHSHAEGSERIRVTIELHTNRSCQKIA